MTKPFILAFDTSGAHCAVALLSGDRILAKRYEPMAKGQAERLMPLVEEVMAEDGLPLEALDAIAVGVGPGNFTGIRIGVSAARGLALALGIPAIAITSFEVMRGPNSRQARARQLVSLPGPRGSLLLQLFEDGRGIGAPHMARDPHHLDWQSLGVTRQTEILGHEADVISEMFPPVYEADGPPWTLGALPQTDLAPVLGQIAYSKLQEGHDFPRPAPVYVRPADAAPSKDTGPTILQC